MAISGATLENIIKPSLRDKYRKGLYGYCNDSEVEADTDEHWFPRACCPEHKQFDKRTPGLFKVSGVVWGRVELCRMHSTSCTVFCRWNSKVLK